MRCLQQINSGFIIEQETQIATTENNISRYLLEGTHIQSNIDGLQKVVRELNAEMDQKNAIILKSETEVHRRINEIERKQNMLDALNKKVEVLLGEAGVRSTFFNISNFLIIF